MRFLKDRGWKLLLLAALLTGAACSEREEPINSGIGTVRIFFADSSLRRGTTVIPGPVTSALIEFEQADLTLASGDVVDLLAPPGEVDPNNPPLSCTWQATTGLALGTAARCTTGRVFNAGEPPQNVVLDVTFRGAVARAAPPEFPDPMDGDFDDDGVPEDGDGDGMVGSTPCTTGQWDDTMDCDDNCPYFANPEQTRSEEGDPPPTFGSSCLTPLGGSFVLDSDSDGVVDGNDNCFYKANPLQTQASDVLDMDPDLDAVPAVGIGIGQECPVQSARIPATTLTLPLAAFQVSGSFETNIVVDLRSSASLTCNWGGDCSLDPAEILVCQRYGFNDASIGCPPPPMSMP